MHSVRSYTDSGFLKITIFGILGTHIPTTHCSHQLIITKIRAQNHKNGGERGCAPCALPRLSSDCCHSVQSYTDSGLLAYAFYALIYRQRITQNYDIWHTVRTYTDNGLLVHAFYALIYRQRIAQNDDIWHSEDAYTDNTLLTPAQNHKNGGERGCTPFALHPA